MVNNSSSKCRYCLHLIRLLVLRSLQYNMRIFSKHIYGKHNYFSDILSRQKLALFRRKAPHMNKDPEILPADIHPVTKVFNVY